MDGVVRELGEMGTIASKVIPIASVDSCVLIFLSYRTKRTVTKHYALVESILNQPHKYLHIRYVLLFCYPRSNRDLSLSAFRSATIPAPAG